MKRMGLLSVALAATLSLACNTNRVATDETATVGTTGDTVSAGDKEFVEQSVVGGLAEVELGRLALERAANADVKKFAGMMVQDHSKSLEALKQVASHYAIAAPAGLDEKHRQIRDRLAGLSGAEFDREYMSVMVDAHETTVDRLQTRASEDRFGDDKGTVSPEKADDPVESSINQWAANTLPTTRHHLEEAKRIHDSLDNRLTRR
jgi:putative membrane protein